MEVSATVVQMDSATPTTDGVQMDSVISASEVAMQMTLPYPLQWTRLRSFCLHEFHVAQFADNQTNFTS
jgi:hypothetical protein